MSDKYFDEEYVLRRMNEGFASKIRFEFTPEYCERVKRLVKERWNESEDSDDR